MYPPPPLFGAYECEFLLSTKGDRGVAGWSKIDRGQANGTRLPKASQAYHTSKYANLGDYVRRVALQLEAMAIRYSFT